MYLSSSVDSPGGELNSYKSKRGLVNCIKIK